MFIPSAIRHSLAILALSIFATMSSYHGEACAAPADRHTIVTYKIQRGDSGLRDNVPVTFGALFAPGDIPVGHSVDAMDDAGHQIPLQVDAKAYNPDGSLRHAILTLNIPHLAANAAISLATVLKNSSPQSPLSLTVLPKDFDVTVGLNTKDGRHLQASARAMLTQQKPKLWLSGNQVTEWWVSGPFRDANGRPAPHLSIRFGIRSYGPGRPVRIEADIENSWTWVPQPKTVFYDAHIIANGKTVFAKADLAQPAHTRWRQIFWWETPANAYVQQDLAYLKKTRAIPNYDPSLKISASEIEKLYSRYSESDHGPMGSGIITGYMPMTGGRGDIAPLPSWTVAYLLTMDKRAYDIMLSAGDLGGSFASHYRNEKNGLPTTTEDFPNISTHSNFVGQRGNLPLPDNGGFRNRLIAQAAHEPSLAFVPYLVTGDRYYLDELEFWSQWNSWGTAPERHGYAKSLVSWDEVRAQAWSLRTLAQAAYIAPDTDPIKATLQRELHANLEWYNKTYTKNPDATVLHAAFRPSTKHVEYSPWMDDYLTWAASYAAQLGFAEAEPFARWKAVYPVQRMINKDYCWILATTYRMAMQNPDLSPVTSWADAYRYTFARFAKRKVDPDSVACGSEEMANVMGLKEAGEMAGNARSPGGYPANLQPALAAAVDLGVPGAQAAWDKFQSRSVRPNGGFYPQWSIVPWTVH